MKKLILLTILMTACGKREVIYVNEPDETNTTEAVLVKPYCLNSAGVEVTCHEVAQSIGVCGLTFTVGNGPEAMQHLDQETAEGLLVKWVPNGLYQREFEGKPCYFQIENYDTF